MTLPTAWTRPPRGRRREQIGRRARVPASSPSSWWTWRASVGVESSDLCTNIIYWKRFSIYSYLLLYISSNRNCVRPRDQRSIGRGLRVSRRSARWLGTYECRVRRLHQPPETRSRSVRTQRLSLYAPHENQYPYNAQYNTRVLVLEGSSSRRRLCAGRELGAGGCIASCGNEDSAVETWVIGSKWPPEFDPINLIKMLL